MRFRFLRQARVVAITALFCAMAGLSGCHRAASKEERALRTELRKALEDQNYERATELARRQLKSKPHDNGSWDRLVRAQFGLRDLAGVKQALDEWRRAVRKPSLNLDEYTGDLAAAQNDDAGAIEAWTNVTRAEPKNVRVLEKIARLEKRRHLWNKEDAAWTALITVQDNAIARINRSICRRRLHRWHDAFEDLEKARAMAPDDPDVQRGAKLLEGTAKFLAEIRELDSSLAISPNDAGLLADRALLFLRAEDPELAVEDAEASGKLAPWAVRPKLFQALALIALGRAEECDRLLVHRFIRLGLLRPEFLETMGRLDSEISAEKNNAELYVSRAWHLNEIGQPSLALEDAETAAKLDPTAAGAYAEASYALTKLGRASEALQQIRRATELDPNFGTAWQYRGELEMARGETLSAIESFTHAIETSQTATALEKREQCYRRLGLLVKAEQDRRAREELARPSQ
jgi:tetratricopeptide (TPR) repeat protein